MAYVAIGSDDHKVVSDERISVKLSLVPVLTDVVFPLDLPCFLIEGTDHAIAGTNDK
jgi:hypothetical protein